MATARASDEWPTPYEYDKALLNHQETFLDRDITSSKLLKTTATKPARLNGSGSPHVCVYRLEKWVVRCFASDSLKNIRPPEDIVQRYEGILAYLANPENALPFLVKHEWIDRGIMLRGTYFPFLKVPYVAQAHPLGKFLSDLYEQGDRALFAEAARVLAQEWLRITQELEKRKIAHGDLDTSNILVRGRYPTLSLHLIDYDGMYVPTFANSGMRLAHKGHENFQPIDAALCVFGPEIDRFSALIIYISLFALASDHTLWERCSASENCLLLGRDDFEHLGQSRRFQLLYQEGQRNASLRRCLDELLESHGKCMPRSLSEILNIYVDVAPPDLSRDPAAPKPFQGSRLPIPLEWGIDSTPAARGLSPVPLSLPADSGTRSIGPSIPVSGSQSSVPSNTAGSAKQVTVQQTLPARQNGKKTAWITLAFIIAVIVIALIIIYFLTHQQLTSASFVLLMELSPLPIHVVHQLEKDRIQERYVDDKA